MTSPVAMPYPYGSTEDSMTVEEYILRRNSGELKEFTLEEYFKGLTKVTMADDKDMKYCGKCKQTLPKSSFAKHAGKKDGLQERCTDCRKQHHKEKGHLSHRERHLRINFGVDSTWYDDTLESQGGCCAICGTSDNGGKSFAVDHDHSTGEVRGLLCDSCNRAIGMLGDSTEVLQNAIDYLKEHKT